jgi:hypothetical protein
MEQGVWLGEVSFTDSTKTTTLVSFSASGFYVLRLTASDSAAERMRVQAKVARHMCRLQVGDAAGLGTRAPAAWPR